MSENVHYKGKLIILTGEGTMEDIFFQNVKSTTKSHYADYIIQNNLQEETTQTKLSEYILNNFYQEYYVGKNNIWRIEKEDVDSDSELFKASFKGNVVEFELKYYNGGTSLNEAIEIATGKHWMG